MRAYALLGAVLMAGCMSAQIHSMARTTRIADSRFADEYADASGKCVAQSDDWEAYDACMAQWYAAYTVMRAWITTTLTLDVVRGRDEFRDVGCRWYRAMEAVDATSPVELPPVKAGLSSGWRKRCGK